jgi:hypothetical protein
VRLFAQRDQDVKPAGRGVGGWWASGYDRHMDIEIGRIQTGFRGSSGTTVTGVVSDGVLLSRSFKERAHASTVEGFFAMESPSSLDAPEEPRADEPAVMEAEAPLQEEPEVLAPVTTLQP